MPDRIDRLIALEDLNQTLRRAREVRRSILRDHVGYGHNDHRPAAVRCLCPTCRIAERKAVQADVEAAEDAIDVYARTNPYEGAPQ